MRFNLGRLVELPHSYQVLTGAGPTAYEHDFLPDSPKIDFVVHSGRDQPLCRGEGPLRPRSTDNDQRSAALLLTGRSTTQRMSNYSSKRMDGRRHLRELSKSRSHFLDYARDVETRLQAAQAIKPDPGRRRDELGEKGAEVATR
jgi:hypothetical protein